MGTYSHQKLLKDWTLGTITNDMATGHTLQHLGLLYEAIESLRQQVSQTEALKATMTTLKREHEQLRRQVEQLQSHINMLIGLNLTVYQLKNEVDTLNHRLDQDSTPA